MSAARQHRVAFGIALSLLVAGALGFRMAVDAMEVVLHKEPVELRRPFRAVIPSEVPTPRGVWKQLGSDELLSSEMQEELGTSQYLLRNYAIDGDAGRERLNLQITFYTGMIDAVPHIPERCFVGNGMQIVPGSSVVPAPLDRDDWIGVGDRWETYTRFGERVRLPEGVEDLAINASEFWDQQAPDHRIAAGYFFVANDGVTARAESVRLLAFRLTDRHAYYCKIQLTYSHPTRSVTAEELGKVGGEFLSVVLPEIMLCLPDWETVEPSDKGATAASRGS